MTRIDGIIDQVIAGILITIIVAIVSWVFVDKKHKLPEEENPHATKINKANVLVISIIFFAIMATVTWLFIDKEPTVSEKKKLTDVKIDSTTNTIKEAKLYDKTTPKSLPLQLDYVDKLLTKYYSSLTNKSFKAADYFANGVTQYILLKKTTPTQIETNIQSYFYKDWQDVSITYKISSFDSITKTVKLIETDNWYRKSYKKNQLLITEATIIFNDENKIISFIYDKKLKDIRTERNH